MNLLKGDCLEVLKTLPDNSVDSLVTDPPAGIGFMGKEWDHHKGGRKEWIAWMTEVMTECLRVMKPGAHGLVWAIPRTSHWTGAALEDAGFEVRDVVTHLFGSGFPKSMDISKAIDKAAGAEREVLGLKLFADGQTYNGGELSGRAGMMSEGKPRGPALETAPATDDAKQWQGWGTALKPASEHWILVRKPCSEKTVAANVLKWGCGGINIDACRIPHAGAEDKAAAAAASQRSCRDQNEGRSAYGQFNDGAGSIPGFMAKLDAGRFPANLVLSHNPDCEDDQCVLGCAAAMLDAQSGRTKSTAAMRGTVGRHDAGSPGTERRKEYSNSVRGHEDSGGASRFFYCAKTSTSERNAGLEGMPDTEGRRNFSSGMEYKLQANGTRTSIEQHPVKNHHPTVKPQKLMRYLCRLITPPKGTVLDPFMGSGSTGVAAKAEGFDFIGIEREAEYIAIAERRIANA